MAETYASAVRMPTHYTTDATTRTCGSGGSSGRPVLISRRLTRMLFGQRHGVSPTGAPNVDAPAAALAADLTAERQRWEQERKMLLEDCTSMRAEAAEAERMLQGWSSMIRDLLFYGFFYGRQQAMLERLTETLHDAVGEIDGVNEVEVTEFRLPAAPDFVPHLSPSIAARSCLSGCCDGSRLVFKQEGRFAFAVASSAYRSPSWSQ